MNNISICITTFKKRLELVKNLINSIRSFYPEIDILVAINGEHEEGMDETYRTEILKFISSKNKVIPIMFTEFRSLSKLWNNLVIFSKTDFNLVLNDDLVFESGDIIDGILNHINISKQEFFTINGTFSHFVISKKRLHELGYFDERLLAHGEEDGDMVWRYIEKYGHYLPMVRIGGIKNVGDYDTPTTNMVPHVYNKPKFNRTFCFSKYKPNQNGIVGMFGSPYSNVIPNEIQYPYEMFWYNNKKYISEGIKFEI
jgi:predicted glycosyltransferase involved in capsule biosynthesis